MAASRVLVYGGKGALGSSVVDYFKAKNWWVLSIDLFQNDSADANVLISPSTESWVKQGQEAALNEWEVMMECGILEEAIALLLLTLNNYDCVNGLAQVERQVEEVLKQDKLEAIVCVAGGWAGGNAASPDLVKNCDLMWKQSVWTSVLASQIAARHLNSGGLLVLTGANAALQGTPGMIGYGMAKAAVHQLVQSLNSSDGGLPPDAGVVGILPVTLDTAGNRKGMPNADFSQWTPLEFVSETVFGWTDRQNRPPSGSLLSLATTDGVTTVSPANK